MFACCNLLSAVCVVLFIQMLDHPNIVKLYDAFEDKDSVYLVTSTRAPASWLPLSDSSLYTGDGAMHWRRTV